MIRKSFIKINNLILDKMISEKFYYLIENKNKNGNLKCKLCLKANLRSQCLTMKSHFVKLSKSIAKRTKKYISVK